VIVRDTCGKYTVSTFHHAVATGASYGMVWGPLFALLFFVPVFGMAVGGGLGQLLGKVEKTGIDRDFQERIRDMIKPGTSALFMVVGKATPVEELEALGGTVLRSPLCGDAERELQQALHGEPVPA
jgi:uncharacterized membrane protein